MRNRQTDIDERAAEWVVRLGSDQVTASEHSEFRAWLEEDPAHAMAYADHAALFAGVRSIDESAGLRGKLRAVAASRRAALTRRSLLFTGGGMAAAAALGAIVFYRFAEMQTIETKLGEQKPVRLSDGSDIILNTDSRVAVQFLKNERRVFLERGQAYFNVAKDGARPFRVFVGADEVRAIGTAFDILRVDNRAKVTLEEGRVAIYGGGKDRKIVPLNAGARPVSILEPGDQARLSPETPVLVQRVNVETSTAWRTGRLILDNALLGETVEDLNRYGGPDIELSSPTLGAIRVSGVFHTSDPVTFVDAITKAEPIRVIYQDDRRIVLAPAKM